MRCVTHACQDRHTCTWCTNIHSDRETDHLPLVFRDQVHLVDETKDLSSRGVLHDCLQAGLIIMHILFHLPALHIEHIDKHLHITEDIITLASEICLHEGFLARAKVNDEFTSSENDVISTPTHTLYVTVVCNSTRVTLLLISCYFERSTQSMTITYPPQSHKLSTRLPKKRTCECSTSTDKMRDKRMEMVGR